MKQTAVEYIVEQLDVLNRERKEKIIDAETYFQNKKSLIEQAKEIEKEQLENAYWDGCSNWDNEKEAEQYYNETFNNK